MRTKLIPALAGLGLALVLAITASGGSGANAEIAGTTLSATPFGSDSPIGTASVTDDPFVVPVVGGGDFPPVAARLQPVEPTESAEAPTPTTAPAAPATTAPPATTTPPTTAAPAPAYPAGSVEAIIESYFGPETPKALSVARCESGLNPSAVSAGGGNHGLFQINNVHQGRWPSVTGAPWSARYDAELNTKFAHWLWSQSGWGPWACA